MAAFPWGALISAGGSLLGGMFGQNAANDALKYQQSYNKKKIQWLVADAEKAGIHPLAALGSPVAGSFASPVGASPMGDAIGDAAAAIGAGISRSEQNARNREQDDLNKELLRAQIRNIDSQTARTLAGATSRTTIARTRDATRYAGAGNEFKTPIGTIKTTGDVFDAEDASQRWGDIAEEVVGIGVLIRDLYNTLPEETRRKLQQKGPYRVDAPDADLLSP